MVKTEKKANLKKILKELAAELLGKLEIAAEIEVKEEKAKENEQADHYEVVIQTQESGLLIGRHGESLNSLQLLLGVIVYKKVGQWVRVIVDIGDYRKMREESLKEMAVRIIEEVKTSGQPVAMPYLTPLERRQIHVFLTDHESVMTESTGEGKDRRLIIKPRLSV